MTKQSESVYIPLGFIANRIDSRGQILVLL